MLITYSQTICIIFGVQPKKMYRYLLAVFICLASFKSYGQAAYFTWGYASNFASVKGINQVVNNYNTSRPWLDKEMKKFSYVDGIAVSFGAAAGNFWVDMEYGFRSQKRKASGLDLTGVDGTRELKLKQGAFAFSGGVIAVEDDGGVAFGIRGEFGTQKALTRIYESSSDKGDWDKINMGLMANVGPMIKIFIAPDEAALATISLYYTFGVVRTNAYELEESVNKSSPAYKDDRFKNGNGIFGFALAIGVFGS